MGSVRLTAERTSPIAVFLPDLGGGGAERMALKLAGGFAGRGYDVDLVVMSSSGPHGAHLPNGVRLEDLGSGRALTTPVPLMRYLRRRRPQVLSVHLDTAIMSAVVARTLANVPVPLIVTLHNNIGRQIASEVYPLRLLFPLLLRLSYKRADALVAVSHGVAESVKSVGLEPNRVATIYNPVVSDALFERAEEAVEHRWLSEGQPPLILAIGRLDPQKDFITLLHAFAQVLSRHQANLLVLGEGPERDSLEQEAQRLGVEESVEFAGYIPNPYPYLRRAEVFALSSRWEGLPTVLIEALALGIKIVSTDCEDGPSEILEGGNLGRLVPVGNAELLAAAIEEALRDGSPTRTADSWTRFAVDSAVDRYLELVEAIQDAN